MVLTLMGGGLVLGATTFGGPSRACRDARAQNLPDAAAVCSTSSGTSHSSGWFGSHSGFSTASAATTAGSVARGGFGAAGHAAGAAGS
jgi:hypothetical protein